MFYHCCVVNMALGCYVLWLTRKQNIIKWNILVELGEHICVMITGSGTRLRYFLKARTLLLSKRWNVPYYNYGRSYDSSSGVLITVQHLPSVFWEIYTQCFS